jgi:hypothetical protein
MELLAGEPTYEMEFLLRDPPPPVTPDPNLPTVPEPPGDGGLVVVTPVEPTPRDPGSPPGNLPDEPPADPGLPDSELPLITWLELVDWKIIRPMIYMIDGAGNVSTPQEIDLSSIMPFRASDLMPEFFYDASVLTHDVLIASGEAPLADASLITSQTTTAALAQLMAQYGGTSAIVFRAASAEAVVPEPTAGVLLCVGLLCVGRLMRQANRS